MFHTFRDGIKCGMHSKCGENSSLQVLAKKLFYNFVSLDKTCSHLYSKSFQRDAQMPGEGGATRYIPEW